MFFIENFDFDHHKNYDYASSKQSNIHSLKIIQTTLQHGHTHTRFDPWQCKFSYLETKPIICLD